MILPAISRRITDPVGDVVTLVEFSTFIGLGGTTPQYNPLPAATEKSESHCKRVFLRQQWGFVYDCLPDAFYIQKGHLESLDKIEVFQADGSSEEVDAGVYEVQESTEFLSRVSLIPGNYWPSTNKPCNGYVVTATLGWEEAKIPAGVKQGVLYVAAEMYSGDIVDVSKMPKAINSLAKWRIIGL